MKVLRWALITAIVIIIAGTAGIILWRQQHNGDELRTATVERRNLVQDVDFTGRLQAQQEVDLAFELSGQLQAINVAVGDAVTAGQLLAQLDPATVELELARARADTAAAQEEARLAWQKSSTEATNTKTENEQLRLKTRQAVIDAKAELDQAETTWRKSENDNGDDSATAHAAKLTYQRAVSAYNNAQAALSQTLETIEKNNESAADAAELALAQYRSTTQAAANLSGLSSLEATRELARLRVNKSELRTPLAGTVTAVEADPGEYAGAGTTVITVATTDNVEITAAVPETDAAKISPDQSATVTFDAFPSIEAWPATVVRVAPAAVLLEGVPTYEVTLALENTEQHLKPGLTANVTVHADSREQVLAIPRRALQQRNGTSYVSVKEGSNVVEREVTTGLVASDGSVEITDGLTEGEQVVLELPTTSKSDVTN